MNRNIIILKADDYKRAIQVYPSILITFYAPWCIHCVNMQADYFKAGDLMQTYNETVPIAKLDCVANA